MLCSLALGVAVAACGSSTGASSRTTTATGTRSVGRAQTQTLQFVIQLQGVLGDLHTATHDLATHALSASSSRTYLKRLSDQASEIANGAWQELPATDPARPLIVRSAKQVAAAAGTLQTVPVSPSTQDKLLAVTDPLMALSIDVGRVGRSVTDWDAHHITQDLTLLAQTLAALTSA